ncbi:MAG TPA: hypothetical protein VMD92_00625 [Acidobacteriaceae bacterium]|nr:hypothetical protein [Acidobacteriaceae bacterium]
MFVLALVADGVSTPYRMQIDAGLSPGATIPALRRLLASGWVAHSKPGPRGRMEHRITSAGWRHLKDGWQELIGNGPSGDFDADLRVALLSLFTGRGHTKAIDFLRASAARPKELPKRVPAGQVTPPTLASCYRQLRQVCARTVTKAQSEALLAVVEQLPRRVIRSTSSHRARQ